MSETREIAKVRKAKLGYESHGIFTARLELDFGGAGQMAGGYALDAYDEERGERVGTAYGCEFIIRVLRAFGADEWSQLEGRTIYALRESDSTFGAVVGLEPLPTERGEPFRFKELAAEVAA